MLDKTLKISFIMIFLIKVNLCDLWGISEYTYFKYCCRSCSIGKSRVSSEVSEKLQERGRGGESFTHDTNKLEAGVRGGKEGRSKLLADVVVLRRDRSQI